MRCILIVALAVSLGQAQESPGVATLTGHAAIHIGGDAYLLLTPNVPQADGPVHTYLDSVLLPAGATYSAWRGWDFSFPAQQKSTGQFWSHSSGPMLFQISGLPVGQHNIQVAMTAGGVQRTASHTVTVLPLQVHLPPLAKWQEAMLRLGAKWCKSTESYGTFSYEQTVWFYDGARVYFQVADWTGDKSWEACAFNIASQYADYVIGKNGSVTGWRKFTAGLRLAYERTKDERYKQAVVLLATAAPWAKSGGHPSEQYIRETAYSLEAMIDAEKLAEPRHPMMGRAVDYLLLHFDRIFRQHNYVLHQTFFDGLAAEALIAYYELTGDKRIPPAIQLMLDWLQANGWRGGKMIYNPDPPGPTCASGCQAWYSNLTNLVAPAAAWYWSVTGDVVYRDFADDLWLHSLDQDPSYSGKEFSQNYRWSFDFVRWRHATRPR